MRLVVLYGLLVLAGVSMVSGAHIRTRAHLHVQSRARPASVLSQIPFERDTYDWWVYALQNQLRVPKNETFVKTHSCDCRCSVNDPASSRPFDCNCDCPTLPQGEQGVAGIPGPQGEQGLQGPQGDRGEPGDKGPPGLMGAKGEQGERGRKGVKGADGANGRPGRSIPGPEGPPGPDGGLNFGPRGVTGPPGPRGFKGNEGIAGTDVRGPTGPRGFTGENGDVGDRGFDGNQGPVGPRGVQGPPGITGPAQERWQVTNLLGQITAQSACVGTMINDRSGFVSAVIRDTLLGQSCTDVCAGLTVKGAASAGTCIDSLQIFIASARGADPKATGRLSRRFGSCTDTSAAPNFCCCSFGEKATAQ